MTDESLSPNEEVYGDDESRDEEDDGEQPRNRRKTKRNVRVEEGGEEDVVMRPGGRSSRYRRQSSSEENQRRRASSSEDDSSARRKTSATRRSSVKERTASFEQQSDSEKSSKQASFASRRAQTVATPGRVEARRTSFGKTKSTSVDHETSPRKISTDRPEWSGSTKVEHERVTKNTLSRKESSTHSESDEPKTASQLRSKFENRGRAGSQDVLHKTKIFGGSTGAAALKARFESPQESSYKRRTSSSSGRTRGMSTDEEDGGHKKFTASALKARFEAKNTESSPVKRNFVIRKGGTGAAARKFNAGAPATNKCSVCDKTVYPLEKIEADGKMYHKFCFKCATCNRTVSLGNYAALQGKIYCKPHLKQLFKLKGNYDEGFGREQRKADWVKKDASGGVSSAVGDEANHTGDELAVNGHEEEEEEE